MHRQSVKYVKLDVLFLGDAVRTRQCRRAGPKQTKRTDSGTVLTLNTTTHTHVHIHLNRPGRLRRGGPLGRRTPGVRGLRVLACCGRGW